MHLGDSLVSLGMQVKRIAGGRRVRVGQRRQSVQLSKTSNLSSRQGVCGCVGECVRDGGK